ncbi:MAG: universal stress protein [Deltaproteobacteria bacterium]|nr:universal stress protein [Deltaproteobacteria bacterium]
MKGIKKILVPVDFSECSKNAFYYSLDIARETKASVFLLNVIDSELVNEMVRLDISTKGQIKKKLEKNAKSELDRIMAESLKKRKGVKIRERLEEGIPFIKILKESKDLGADIIVMGSFGTSSPMLRFFFGSTVEQVLRGSKIPVVCVPLSEVIEG